MHITGADGPDQTISAIQPDCERNKHVPPCNIAADRQKSRFCPRVRHVGNYSWSTVKHLLDFGLQNAVLGAFRAVGVVPIEPVKAN